MSKCPHKMPDGTLCELELDGMISDKCGEERALPALLMKKRAAIPEKQPRHATRKVEFQCPKCGHYVQCDCGG